MSEVPKPSKNLSEDEIWDKLHISANYRMEANGRKKMLAAGLELLKNTLSQIKSFSALSGETKYELITQKKHYGLSLTPEEEQFWQHRLDD